MTWDDLRSRIFYYVLLEEALFLHGVEKHLPLSDGDILGNAQELGERGLGIVLVSLGVHV